ncbi:MAG: T9SS type A sorting domain-containing protein, partial [Lentimicrobiaceae bacterium]|nr:T9SS type A sorting domain-containing protein [Lentimicrobiaceae bacterium]
SIITSNPQYVFEATQNTNLTANFEYTDAITEIDEDSFTIYPNPASDFITIETLNALESDVVIYDLTGKIIIRKFLHSGDNKIDVRNINSGIYVISINGLKSKLIIQ